MNWKRWLVWGSIGLNVALLAGLLAGPFIGEAMAQNRATTTSGGGIVAAAARSRSSSQALYVVDSRSKRMLVFGPQATGGPLQVVDVRDLAADFGAQFSGDVVVIPLEISNSLEAVAVIDTVGRRMITYVSVNYGRLAIIDSKDLGKMLQ